MVLPSRVPEGVQGWRGGGNSGHCHLEIGVPRQNAVFTAGCLAVRGVARTRASQGASASAASAAD
jgi:hypothetical protein